MFVLFVGSFYGRFLRTKMINRPTTTMATNKPAIAGTKYWSAIDCGACVGAGVAVGASLAKKDVSAEEK